MKNHHQKITDQDSCKNLVNDLVSITDTLDKNMHLPELHRRIDIFFYIEKNVKAKLLCQQLIASEFSDHSIRVELLELYGLVKRKWQNDFKLITPYATLHKSPEGTGSFDEIKDHKKMIIL